MLRNKGMRGGSVPAPFIVVKTVNETVLNWAAKA